jgi:predicted dehydrogenase
VSTLPAPNLTKAPGSTRRVRVGVIGAGLIAQVMHLNYLRELADRYEIAAVCDVVEENGRASADRFGVTRVLTDWRDLLSADIDAVLVLTGGSHAPMAIEAARAGLHVLVEKPMCFSTAEAGEMVAAAESAGVTLMVAYNKRYDPAYLRFQDEVANLADRRFLRVTTLESPIPPYVTQYPLELGARPPAAVLDALRADSDERIEAAIPGASPELRRIYHMVLLDTLVHELNAVRGLLGEPDRIDWVDLRATTTTVMLRFGDLPVAIHWIDLPGIARYRMEFAIYGPERRATLAFPSPFLRNAPALLSIETGMSGDARSSATEEITTYDSSFRRELIAFHDAIVDGKPVPTTGRDSMRDMALCAAIIRCAQTSQPVDHPTRMP